MQVLAGETLLSTAVARHILKRMRKSALVTSNKTDKPIQNQPALTPKELDVLQFIAKGYTSTEIAELTNRAPSTILVHVRNIYKKLSVHSRGEVVFEAINLGLIRPG